MTSNDDNRQTKTQRQLTPTHILERAIDQLPPDERGRAREALEELEDRADKVERLQADLQVMEAKTDDWKEQFQLAEARIENVTDEVERLKNAIRQMRDESVKFERERIAKFALREDTDDDQQ